LSHIGTPGRDKATQIDARTQLLALSSLQSFLSLATDPHLAIAPAMDVPTLAVAKPNRPRAALAKSKQSAPVKKVEKLDKQLPSKTSPVQAKSSKVRDDLVLFLTPV